MNYHPYPHFSFHLFTRYQFEYELFEPGQIPRLVFITPLSSTEFWLMAVKKVFDENNRTYSVILDPYGLEHLFALVKDTTNIWEYYGPLQCDTKKEGITNE